jgi:hypothetical protein
VPMTPTAKVDKVALQDLLRRTEHRTPRESRDSHDHTREGTLR